MPARPAPRLAWLMLTISIALWAPGLVVSAHQHGVSVDWLYVMSFLAYAAVGAVVAARRPENPIGWVFSAVGLASSVAGLNWLLESPPLTDPAWRPVQAALEFLVPLGWITGLGLAITFAVLLFPTGRLPSPRWRPVAWLAGLAIIGVFIDGQLSPPDQPAARTAEPVAALIALLSGLLVAAAVLGSAASLLVRFRRSRGQERQQLKWLAAAAALLAVLVAAEVAGEAIAGGDASPLGPILAVGVPLAMAAVPIAAGIAVLRYRLYAIDLLINRTLVYGTLTVVLAAVYLGTVVLLQGLVRALSGQGSELAIIASTLAIAALFQPLRRRLQGFIDRRFYRPKYDAARTLAAFSARLREEVDLATLTDELLTAVDETMQPSSVSLWIRPPASRRPGSS